MKFLFLLIAAGAGIGSALQSGSNSGLQKTLQSPFWTMALIGGVLLGSGLVLALSFGGPIPPAAKMGQAPWWAWLGGLFGLFFLYATTVVSPKLGAATFAAIGVTASTVTSLLMDNFGLLGFDVHRAGIGRIVGALLMVAGVSCIAVF